MATTGERVRLVLVAGLDRNSTDVVATRLLRDEPRTAVVHHDLREIAGGVVHRRLRLGSFDTATVLELAHGCVSCTLREDLLPLLHQLITSGRVGRIVLHLDPSVEPEPVCWALHHAVVADTTILELATVEAVLTVIDEGTWLADATGDLDLAERGLGVAPDDERTLAQVAVGQVEFADAVLITGRAEDTWTAARTGAVLDRLAPLAVRAPLSSAGPRAVLAAVPAAARRGEVDDAHGPLLRGSPPLEADCGVFLTLFQARRPFHPHRLHGAMDALLDGVVRARGRLWVASQPDIGLWLESAGGGLSIGNAGAWLATAGPRTWDAVSPERRAKAALDWHPRYGDRTQELVVISHLATPDQITTALHGALLTGAELAEGEAAWRHYPDPFSSWHTDPCDEPDTDTLLNRKDIA